MNNIDQFPEHVYVQYEQYYKKYPHICVTPNKISEVSTFIIRSRFGLDTKYLFIDGLNRKFFSRLFLPFLSHKIGFPALTD